MVPCVLAMPDASLLSLTVLCQVAQAPLQGMFPALRNYLLPIGLRTASVAQGGLKLRSRVHGSPIANHPHLHIA